MAVFETAGRGSTPRWGTVDGLSLECGGGTRLCEGRGPGSTPGEDIKGRESRVERREPENIFATSSGFRLSTLRSDPFRR